MTKKSTDPVPHYDIAVLGDVRTGKSSIINKLITGNFTEEYTPTAADVYMTMLRDGDKRIASLQLFDTAGGFEFPVMLRLTIAKCQAFFVVYSVASCKSLEIAKKQLEEICEIKGKYFPCILVGNKKDVGQISGRAVSYEKGVQTAVQHGCSYIEVCAKDGCNITNAFLTMVKKINYTETIQSRLYSEPEQESRKRTVSMRSLFGQFMSNSSDSESENEN